MSDPSSIGRPTFGGLATGLDTKVLLDTLLSIERQPLDRIRSRRAEVDRERSLMRELNGMLLALRSAAREIDNRNTTGSDIATTEEFLRYSGSSTNEDIVGVTAGPGAAPGDIDVVVTQLARGSRRFSASFSDSSAVALAAGQSITIELADGDPSALPEPIEATSINVVAESDLTLGDLRDQINSHPDNVGKVRADILQVGEDDFQLVFTTSGTGLENELAISGDLAIQELENPEDPNHPDKAQDAIFEVFGQTITRSSNAVEDVLEGITFRLESVSETDAEGNPIPETVSVEVDVEAVAESLQKLADAYNAVMDFIGRQFTYNETAKRSGPLAGDSTLQNIQSQLREVVSQGYRFSRSPNNPFASGQLGGSISAIGLELGSDGRLSVDQETLEEALALDALSVRQFLSGREGDGVDGEGNPIEVYDPGFAQVLAERLEEIVRSGDGTMAQRDQGYADRLKGFDDSIARFELRLADREETLIRRFSALETIVAGLQSQQGFLTGLVVPG